MIELKLEISGEYASEVIADLRHLAMVLSPSAEDAKVPVTGGTTAEAPTEAPKRRSRSRAASADTAAPKEADKPTEDTAPQGETPAAPAEAPTAPADPTAAPTGAVPPPADPAAPTAPAEAPAAPAGKAYTLEDLSVAGSALIDNNGLDGIMALMGKYGVQAITQLKESDYPAFAADLRALGAPI